MRKVSEARRIVKIDTVMPILDKTNMCEHLGKLSIALSPSHCFHHSS